MEVRIGIVQSPREISFETDESAESLRASFEAALTSEATALVSFTDTKGKQYLVPTATVAYIELGGTEGRKVGFIN